MDDGRYPQVPRVGVGAFVVKDDRVLLVKRAKAPSLGLWAIPGGRVELGETLERAAERETLEETGIIVKVRGEPVFWFDFIERDEQGRVLYHYVIVDFRADYVSGNPAAGDDAGQVAWVAADEMDKLPVNPPTRRLLERMPGFLSPGSSNQT